MLYAHPDDLYFDYQNPRLAEFGITSETSQAEILRILWVGLAADEIAYSIVANGYFENDPLIVISENKKLIVIEGNRRLAAIKAILQPDQIKAFPSILINSLTPQKKKNLEKIPYSIAAARQDAWDFIGFKHVNGPQKWSAYAKAKYVAQVHEEYGVSLNQIALQIGDTHGTIKKLYQGLKVINQAEQASLFDRKKNLVKAQFSFSHLYTGIQYEGIRDFIGLRDVSLSEREPVPSEKFESLKELLVWLYGDKRSGIQPVIKSQNPDLRVLDQILKSKEATQALRKSSNLSLAFDITIPDKAKLERSLYDAKRSLQEAHSAMVIGFEGEEELVFIAATIANIADDLYQKMMNKNDDRPRMRRTRFPE